METSIALVRVASVAAVLAACSHDVADDPTADDVGTVQLALTGVDGQMQAYRLRAATFDIRGTRYTDYTPVETYVATEEQPDGEFLRAKLIHGDYSVSLRAEEWFLERITGEGPQRVEQAVLLSPSSQHVFIERGGVSRVAFQFGVDGELIDFFGGSLEIGIGIENAPDAGAAGEGG